MNKTREVLVIVVNSQRRDRSVAELLELRREHLVSLRGKDLGRHAEGLDLALLRQRRVGGADAVDEVLALGAELEDGPAAVAEANGADLLEVFLQLLDAGLHLGVALLLAVAADETVEAGSC